METPNQETSSALAGVEASAFAQQVADDMKDGNLELPGFPEAVLRLQRALETPDWSTEDVVKILSAEPGLAARALQIANSVAMRRREGEITDLRSAVNRMGANLMRSVAVAFAISQLRLRKAYSAAARAEIERIWRDSVTVAAVCFVLARQCTSLNADRAMLSGLLHVLGRLYIVMRAEGVGGTIDAATLELAKSCEAAICKSILAGWELPQELQHAVESQHDLGYQAETVSLTDVLIVAKAFTTSERCEDSFPALERLAAVKGIEPRAALEEHAEDIRALRASLGD